MYTTTPLVANPGFPRQIRVSAPCYNAPTRVLETGLHKMNTIGDLNNILF
jgi:hypothetical protein